ncbi:MAG: hypothetical protein M3O28_11780, partial [Actinomycetota bacterium]|nr:hypothetical protein [Actinomycetota bacterium]
IDAYTHYDLASRYAAITSGTVNQGVLFQIEATLAILAGVLLVIRLNLVTTLLTVALTAGGAVALVVYRYNNVGKIGPIPNMYEPVWFSEKKLSLVGELVALVAALGLLAIATHAQRRSGSRGRTAVAA